MGAVRKAHVGSRASHGAVGQASEAQQPTERPPSRHADRAISAVRLVWTEAANGSVEATVHGRMDARGTPVSAACART